MPSDPSSLGPMSGPSSLSRFWIAKLLSLIVAGVLFGWAYNWAAPRFYKPEITAGFWLGTLHGALMPTALPSLLMSKDVPIYAEKNTGRFYKLGYICGINMCGLVFFGLAFRQSDRRRLSQSRTHRQ